MFASALLGVAELTLHASPATAREARSRIDVPAGPLARSLPLLASQTGLSIGVSGRLPSLRTRAVRGTMTGAQALTALLAGSGYRAVQVGASAFRIEPVPPPARIRTVQPVPILPPDLDRPLPDIVVTAQKRSQSLDQTPLSVTIVVPDGAMPGRFAPGSRDLALAVEGLALTNLGPGRNRQFIRGVADSPFNGNSQSTVAVQLDEARITFDAPDPDLRLVDMEKIEILKGPQGPLHGSGALGGIYRLVTRKPDLGVASARVSIAGQAVQHGELGGGAEAVINLPVVAERVAVRAVGYGMQRGGWIDNVGMKRDANMSSLLGGRIAVRWQPLTDWTIDVSGVLQNINARDSQYVSTSDDTLKRIARIPEPADNDFRALTGTVEGRIGSLKLLAATSYVHHTVDVTLDASPAAGAFGVPAPVAFEDDRTFTISNHEFRVSPVDGSAWIAGASFLKAHSHVEGRLRAEAMNSLVETLDRNIMEYAVFAEGSFALRRNLRATLGGRLFHSITEDETTEEDGGRALRITKSGIVPSLSLSWTPRPGRIMFLRYARAFRPGGLAPAGETAEGRFDSDELDSIDLGARSSFAGGDLTAGMSVYYMIWNNIQSNQLLANGLVSTRNVGRGEIMGAEANAEWRARPDLLLSAGLNVQRAILVNTQEGVELEDLRLPVAPSMTARVGLKHEFDVGGRRAALSAQANYVGRARLTFDEGLDRRMGNFTTVASAATIADGDMLFSARIDNLFDVKGNSFAFGNPFSIRQGRQFTPLRPRTLTLTVQRAF